MKSMLLFAASLAVFTGISQEKTLDRVIQGFEKGNAALIEVELTNEVDLTVGEFEDFCSKPQVSAKLREFFSGNKPSKFVMKHSGNSSSEETYTIGELTTENGLYRVTVFIDKEGSSYRVSQLKIE